MKLPIWIIAALLACNMAFVAWDHRPRMRLPSDVMAQPDVSKKVDLECYRLLIEREAEHRID